MIQLSLIYSNTTLPFTILVKHNKNKLCYNLYNEKITSINNNKIADFNKEAHGYK